MLSEMRECDFHGNRVRIMIVADSVFFVAEDVCEAIGVDDPERALLRCNLDQGQKTFSLPDGTQAVVLSEYDTMILIAHGKDGIRVRFGHWLVFYILPKLYAEGIKTQLGTPEKDFQFEQWGKQQIDMINEDLNRFKNRYDNAVRRYSRECLWTVALRGL